MRLVFRNIAFLSLLLACGCQTGAHRTRQTANKEPDKLPQWDWASALPSSVPRAESLPVTIDGATLASIVAPADSDLQLASAPLTQAQVQLTHVAGKTIRNFEQLHAMVERAANSPNKVSVAFAPGDSASIAAAEANSTAPVVQIGLELEPRTIEVTPATLRYLEQNAARNQNVIRIVEDGNPWILIRDGNVRCKLTARVERTCGLMQLVMAVGLVDGSPKLLPADVRATCQGKALRCLTVAEALETLYGTGSQGKRKEAGDSDHASFSVVSQLDDYQIPTNYKRLQEETKRATGLPACAMVPGAVYPGSPVLGDARALSSFSLTPQLCQAGEPEKLGWIIFSDPSLAHGGLVEIQVDLGHGPTTIAFTIPKP